MAAISPLHLLEQADMLMRAQGGGPPRQANLRRAISSAYYAVFHAIATAAADAFVGRAHRHASRYALAYRHIEHKRLKDVCEGLAKQTVVGKYARHEPPGGFGAEIKALSAAAASLQEQRHSADYDPMFRTNSTDAALAVALARAAIADLKRAPQEHRAAFLALVAFQPR